MTKYREKVLDAIEHPTWVLQGYAGSLVAVLRLRRERNLHVVYREISRDDGFVITSFLARKVHKDRIIWPKNA